MDKKISQLTAAGPLTGSELLPLVQSGQTLSTTTQDIADLVPSNINELVLYESGAKVISFTPTSTVWSFNNLVLNFEGLGDGSKFTGLDFSATNCVQIKNANLLTGLTNTGVTNAPGASSGIALNLKSNSLSQTALNDLFTQLPAATLGAATIRVSDNPGSATCNPTIATSKGYTVVTASCTNYDNQDFVSAFYNWIDSAGVVHTNEEIPGPSANPICVQNGTLVKISGATLTAGGAC